MLRPLVPAGLLVLALTNPALATEDGLRTGMSREQVRTAWGSPDEVQMISAGRDGGEESWTYYCGSRLPAAGTPTTPTLSVRDKSLCLLHGNMVNLYFQDGQLAGRSQP